jgi:tape measure domain-containing protein
MANDGFIEILSPNALEQLKQASVIVDALALKIEKINSFKAPTTPSGADNGAKQMIADLKAQEQAIKQATNALIQEEKVKQQIIATQIKEDNARKTSISLREAERKAILAQQQAEAKAAISSERQALANQRLNDAYGKLNRSRNEAARVLQNLIASETASNAEIRKAQREFDILDGKVKKADQAVGNFSKNVGNYKNALSGATQLMSAFGIATGVYLAADLVKNIFQTTKELQSLDLALKMVSETQDRYAANTSFVRELSERWGIEIKGLTEQFTQFYVNAKGKLSEDAIRKSFEGIAKAGALMGISIDKQNDAFYAFNQMLSKGTVQAEELKKQLGNALPGAIKAATMAYQELNPNLKVTEQMMLDQMKAGKLVSNEMVPAIIRAYQKLYGIENVNGVNTLAAANNRLNNSWTEMIRNMNETSTDGVGKWFDYVLKSLNFLIVEADRFINSWDTINKKAAETGTARGKKSFTEDINKATSRRDEETIIKFTEESTLTAISRAEGELKDVEQYLKDLEEWSAKNIAQAAVGIGLVKRRNANFRKEDLIEEIAYLEAKANAAKTFIKDREDKLKSPKAGVSDKTLTDEEIAALKKAKKEREKLLKEQEQFEEELRKNAYQRKISDLEREKEIIKDLKDLETTSLEDKLFLEDAYAFKQIQINQAVYDEKIRLAKKEYNEKFALVKGNASQEQKVLKYKNNQEAIALNDLLTANEDALAASLKNQNKLKEDALKTDLEKTKEWYAKNPPMFLQSDREREEAEKIKAILKDLQNEFRNYIQGFQQSFFNIAGFGQSFDFFIKLDEAGKTAFDRINQSNLTTKEKFQANFLAISESAQEMFNFINQMSAQNFDAEKERLEQETEIALAFAGDSQTAKDEINRQAEEKRKEIQRREFKAKKEQAVFNIAIDTAQAIMATYGQAGFFGGIAGAAIIAAIGAAQIAMVQAQEMPAYKTGTDNHIGGAMLVNDGSGSNYKETIQTPDGKIYQPKERNVIMNAPKGTKVFTHDQWQRNLDNILTSNSINYAQPNVVVNSGMSDEQVNRIVSTIANKQESHLSLDKSGIKHYVSNGHTTKEILNSQVTFGR